jgi:hypothetical protein
MNTITKSEYALKVQTALADIGMTTRFCGQGDPPIVPYEQDGWLLETLKSGEEYTMPTEVLRRLEKLRKVCKVEKILIAHEIDKRQPLRLEIPREVVQVASHVLPALGSILVALGTILTAVAMVLFQLLLFVFTLDPVVIAVIRTESDELIWLECAKWYE